MENSKVVYWKDGTCLIVEDGITWEYENDENWLKTVPTLDVIMAYFERITKWMES